jgi:hypothetical protein
LNGVCLKFWYHLTGAYALNVYTRTSNQIGETPIWKISNDQGKQWRSGGVTVQTSLDFEIVFEGVLTQGFGDISLDDVVVNTDGPCERPVDCGFENSLCSWAPVVNIDSYNLDFLRITADQLSKLNKANSKISVDKTTNSKYGHFLWTGRGYTTNNKVDQKAGIVSETIFSDDYSESGACFSLWYYLDGNDSITLNIYRKPYKSDMLLQFSTNTSTKNSWNRAEFSISSLSPGSTFEMYIEALLPFIDSSTPGIITGILLKSSLNYFSKYLYNLKKI